MENPKQVGRFLLLLGLCVLGLYIAVPLSYFCISLLGDFRVIAEHEKLFIFVVYMIICGLLYIGLMKMKMLPFEGLKQTHDKYISADYLCVMSAICGVLFIGCIAIQWIRKGVNAPSVYGTMIGIVTGSLISIFLLAFLNRSAKKGVFILKRLTGLQVFVHFLLIVLTFVILGAILGTISRYYSLSGADGAIFCITWLCGNNVALGLLWSLGVIALQRHYGKKFYFQRRKEKKERRID